MLTECLPCLLLCTQFAVLGVELREGAINAWRHGFNLPDSLLTLQANYLCMHQVGQEIQDLRLP